MNFIFGWVAKKLGPYMNLVTGVLVAVLLCAVLGLGYLYREEVKLSAATEQRLEQVQSAITHLENQIKTEKMSHTRLQTESAKITQDFQDMKRELNGYKNREDVVIRKPTLVQLKIQKSFDGLMDEIHCTTGDARKCGKE